MRRSPGLRRSGSGRGGHRSPRPTPRPYFYRFWQDSISCSSTRSRDAPRRSSRNSTPPTRMMLIVSTARNPGGRLPISFSITGDYNVRAYYFRPCDMDHHSDVPGTHQSLALDLIHAEETAAAIHRHAHIPGPVLPAECRVVGVVQRPQSGVGLTRQADAKVARRVGAAHR